jgi:hypothetical protein
MMRLNKDDLKLLREWFGVIRGVAPEYIQGPGTALYGRIHEPSKITAAPRTIWNSS